MCHVQGRPNKLPAHPGTNPPPPSRKNRIDKDPSLSINQTTTVNHDKTTQAKPQHSEIALSESRSKQNGAENS